MQSDQQEFHIFLADEAATEALGGQLAKAVVGAGHGGTLFLKGNLGMGKTTLSRGFMRGLGHEGAVKSPTYTLVEPYEHLQPAAYHFDLYRLGDPEELEYMGIRDYFEGGNACLIEWPERGRGVLPQADLVISLERDGEGRSARLVPGTKNGESLLAMLQDAGNKRSEAVSGQDKRR
ncbi:ATPase [Marinobacter lipolyticus SM19]|uniref:tRNA threonylcarbamoyladenosine biosynthesis protein TsaE n=1 Tax=Marinobacter lipolyticus SM19 TaxID=1318628 RepID=R8B5H1_9GAMM|nr:tRNA (adenosine(37)-N6)-threonylcarbamoyltransferase complex ATPase subunit type 1 TsaE [Marinobacter lipolyticus]EON93801.1 ATPase [Marinobacter lipolyticus SM19]